MPWFTTDTLDRYLLAAGSFLRSAPIRHTQLLTTVMALRGNDGANVLGTGRPLYGWWQSKHGSIESAFLHTPPHPLLITQSPAAVLPSLVRALIAARQPVLAVNGDQETSMALARAWAEVTGAAFSVLMRQRLYRLVDLVPILHPPPGRLRVAERGDRDLLIRWYQAFARETGAAATSSAVIDQRIAHGGLSLWEIDDLPVSCAGITRAVAGMVRVAPVYTTVEQRGRGFAGAATAAVSRSAIEAGAEEVLLFTDRANPTSNRLYRRLGFQPVEERLLVSLTLERPQG